LILIKLDYLGRHPQSIELIAQWHQDEWQYISPHLSTQKRIDIYRSYRNSPSTPHCMLALVDNCTAGSASVVASDLDSHRHLGPWLASVFVHPKYRQQGIASQLIERCIENARTSGATKLYLFTPDQLTFYAKRGWQLIESSICHGESIDIMCFDLKPEIEPLKL